MDSNFKSAPILPSEITPKDVYLSRRDFLKTMGIVSAGAALLVACGAPSDETPAPPATSGLPADQEADSLSDELTAHDSIINYNNYYEFTTDKERVASLAEDFKSSPWTVEVDGLVNNPKTFGIEDLLSQFTQEERIYRMRCVEAWSMVIPWTGFTLASLLQEVEPTSDAKYVRFETVNDPDQMPGMKNGLYPWPYQEGLRLDEAFNDLTLLAIGKRLKGIRINNLGQEMIFQDMHAVIGLQTFHGNAGADHFGQAVDINCFDSQLMLDLFPHILAPWLGTVNTHPKLKVFRRYPDIGHCISQIEGIRRSSQQDGGAKVTHDCNLAFGITA